jgi:5-methyltetrahydrofolate--homocysteine methyltransferase
LKPKSTEKGVFMSSNVDKIAQAVITGDRSKAVALTEIALNDGVAPELVLKAGLIPAMEEVGRLYAEGEYFVPEMLVAARAMKAALEILRPDLVESDVKPTGTMVVGTVKGDLHDIGKNLVAMMVEGAGFDIVDLGTDVAPERFVAAVRDSGANLVGLSALLTTTMPMMRNTVQAIVEAGLREQVKIIIGGAPITADFAEEIGADGYAADASRAAILAKALVA